MGPMHNAGCTHAFCSHKKCNFLEATPFIGINACYCIDPSSLFFCVMSIALPPFPAALLRGREVQKETLGGEIDIQNTDIRTLHSSSGQTAHT